MDTSVAIDLFAEAGLAPAADFEGWIEDRYDAALAFPEALLLAKIGRPDEVILVVAGHAGTVRTTATFAVEHPLGRLLFVAAVTAASAELTEGD